MMLPIAPVIDPDKPEAGLKRLGAWAFDMVRRCGDRLNNLEANYQKMSNPVVLPLVDRAALTALRLGLGDRAVMCRDGAAIYPVYSDGANWKKFSDDSIVA